MKRDRLKTGGGNDFTESDSLRGEHLNRQIPPLAHTSMYLWHKYWSRKTWNVVSEFIKTYCPEDGIVFDPFAGSGITAMEALKNGRRAIVCDLNPIATEIIRLTVKPVEEIDLESAFQRVEEKARGRIESLYLTKCRSCGKDIVFNSAVWKENNCVEIRYKACPRCGDKREKDCKPNGQDLKLLSKIEKENISQWYPTNKLYYPDGMAFKEKQKYESVDELFTRRNLKALAILMEAIEEEPNGNIRKFLKMGFSSMSHLCSRMNPISEAGHFTPFSSAWIHHSYWYPSGPYMEQNVWNKFSSAIYGHQGLLKAKIESNSHFRDKIIGSSFKQVVSGKADIYIHTGSCLDLIRKIPEESVDYIFTDPPYDASIQFGELSYMWVSWLGINNDYIQNILSSEIVRNDRQHKDFTVYNALLSDSFRGMFKIIKPRHYLTVTFHNPTFKVRNATIRAGVFAGFDFQSIHHQELARPSAKSLLQPFGSAQGDFYLRFHRTAMNHATLSADGVDEVRFEKIVVDTTIKLLAERAEPTPYTIIINYIDPVLAKHGFFSSLKTGLDVNEVLKNHLDREFVLLPAKLGGAEGKLWWFTDTSIVPRLNEIPLSERVEQTVYRKLYQKGKVSFTEMWDAVSTEFPNSLTSDSMSIKGALKIYAREVSGGLWMLKPEIRQRINEHSEMISILCSLGTKQGYDIWVGRREQHETDFKSKKLSEYMTINKLDVRNAENLDVVENIDLLWIKEREISALFEIESTTSLISAVMRGSNVNKDVHKYMVLPEERETQLDNKMSSPLFREHFENENWYLIYFDALRASYNKQRGKLDINSIVNVKRTGTGTENQSASKKQQRLFLPFD